MENRLWMAPILALLVASACSRPQAVARTATQGGAGSAAPAMRAESAAVTAAGPESAATPSSVASSSAAAVQTVPVYVDVRTPKEFAAGHLRGAINIPLNDLGQRWTELKAYTDRPIVLYCRTGHRAGIALTFLRQQGLSDVTNGGGLQELQARLQVQKK